MADLYPKIAEILSDALNVDADDITPDSTLHSDLGAESIDILDITFRLEREFGVKIPRNDLFPDKIFDGNDTYIQNGTVTPDGITRLKKALPHSDFTKFEANPTYDNIDLLFTVNTITRYIQNKLTKTQPV